MVSLLFDVLRAALERAEPLGLRRVEQHPEQGLGVRRDLLGVLDVGRDDLRVEVHRAVSLVRVRVRVRFGVGVGLGLALALKP